jgi:hypothetical protein
MKKKGKGLDRDLAGEVEEEMAATGKHSVVPREGLVGAHTERRESVSGGTEEPVGAGADVAPTRKAVARERERHRLQRELPAGTRAELERAAAQADDLVLRQRLTAEGGRPRLLDRARLWMGEHARATALATASAFVLASGATLYFALRGSST